MPESSNSTGPIQLSNPVYDQLKRTVMVALPLIGTLYFSLAQIWGLPAAEQVVGSILALNLFLGGLAQVSSKGYNADVNSIAGKIKITPNDDGGKFYQLVVDADPEELSGKSEVRFKIVDKT